MTKAPTPEEIATAEIGKCFRLCDQPPSVGSGQYVMIDFPGIRQALRSYGDRRYCEARDAAARVAEDMAAGWVPGQGREANFIAEAIRKLTPEAKP